MADLPPSSQPLPPLPTSPSSTPPAVQQDSADSGEDLSSLSPLAVLQKRGSAPMHVPPVLPTPPAPIPPVLPSAPAPVMPAPVLPTPVMPAPAFKVPEAPQSPTLPVLPSLPVQPVQSVPPVLPTPPAPLNMATPPASTGSPLDVDIDRDELLQDASVVPQQTFILPTPPRVPVAPTPPAPVVRAQQVAPTLPVQPTQSTLPTAPAPTQQVPVQKPLAPLPAAPVAPVEHPALPLRPVQPKAPTPYVPVANQARSPFPPKSAAPLSPVNMAASPDVHEMASVHHHRMILFSTIVGGIVAVLLLVGGMYALADNGTRVPFFYTYISGLNGSALSQSQNAQAKIAAMNSYKYVSSSSIVLDSGGTSTDTSSSSAPVYKLVVTIPKGQVTNNGDTNVADYQVAANGNPEVPVTVLTSKASMIAYFPTDQSKDTVLVKSDQVNQTLLAAAITPLTAQTMVKAVKSEVSYQKSTLAGRTVAAYNVGYDCAVLQAKLPTGFTLDTCAGTIAYMWKSTDVLGGLPAEASVKAALSYQGKKYAYSSDFQYVDWNGVLGNGTSEGDLVLINNVKTTDIVTAPISAQGMISRLGINFSQIPHDTTLDATQGDGTAVVAITPSGESTATVVDALVSSAQVPPQPASDAAKARDVQRKKDLSDIQQALIAYKAKTGSYPIVATGDQVASNSILFSSLVPTYLTKMPLDPLKGTYYYYYQSSDGSAYSLRAVLENASDSTAKKGAVFSFYELSSK